MIYVVLPIAMAIISGGLGAYVASERGRPPIEGAIFGLLLGPIGVLVAAMMPVRHAEPARRSSLRDAPELPDYADVDVWDVHEIKDMPIIVP